MGPFLYLDASAIVKLVVVEPESAALRRALADWPERASSVVSRVEVVRAAGRIGADAVRRARAVCARLTLIALDDDVVERAMDLAPAHLRTLDAIHLATALSLGDDLGAVCAYDVRLVEAARSAGVEVISPA